MEKETFKATAYDQPIAMSDEDRAFVGKCIGFQRIVLFENAMLTDGEFPATNMTAAIAQLMLRSDNTARMFKAATELYEFAQSSPLGRMLIQEMMGRTPNADTTVQETYRGDTAGGGKTTIVETRRGEEQDPPPNPTN